MPDELNLSLRERKGKGGKPSALVILLLFWLLGFAVANLVVALRSGPGGRAAPGTGELAPDAAKELALKLEKQGLRTRAVEAWQEYLDGAVVDDEGRAKIWYRVGKLYQDAQDYDRALAAYYRSESLAEVAELKSDLGQRVQRCLEAAGKFSALRHELAGRVGMQDDNAGDEVLAEIGNHKVTKLELDRRIEEQIERQLSMMAGFMPDEQMKQQKESLLKRFSTAQERERFLNQLVLQEVLYRKATEDKLTENAEVRAMLLDTERALLAQQVLQKELADRINITQSDLQNYYGAHKSQYKDPEEAQVSQILVADEGAANTVLKKLSDGGEFEQVAKEYSNDADTKDKGGKLEPPVRKGSTHIAGIGNSAEAEQAIFGTEAGTVVEKPIKTDKGFHVIKVRERKPERQKTLDEVRAEVYRSLRQDKEREVQEALLTKLKERYNVIIHQSKLQPESTDDENQTGTKPQ